VSPLLARRLILLSAAALIAVVLSLAVAAQLDDAGASSDLPKAVPAPGGGWFEARAGLESASAYGQPTACGHVLERETLGVSHPVLVCGAKLYIGHDQTEILTQVVSHGPTSAAVQFGLTEALARKLGVSGRARIRWRFAGR
jgi:hypothetical protein